MLNENGQRELAYLVTIDKIEPIVGSDNCESATVLGWHCMVRKDTLKEGDIAVYFEIDSHLDTNRPEFAFLEKKKGNIKTQKYTFGGKGNFISQGLIMPISDFGWKYADKQFCGGVVVVVDDKGKEHLVDDESRFLTEKLGVTYAVVEDNVRKAPSADKYKKMAQRHQKIAKTWVWKKLYKTKFGKKILFFFFGKPKDKKYSWRPWIRKTDEDRIQSCPWLLNDTEEIWYPTEKVDGSSTTISMKGFGRKRDFVVCSRNVVFDEPGKKCFYDTNIYTEMAEKYDMKNKLSKMMDDLKDKNIDFITIQGETYGEGVQKRDYGLKGHDIAVFNVIFGYKDGTQERLNPVDGEKFAHSYGLPYVPVLNYDGIHLPNDCDAVIAMAGEEKSKIDGGMREGIVFRSKDGTKSFKAVSNEFLLKYHG